MDFTYHALKARQREIRGAFPESLGLRTHRALSWLNRAEQAGDADGRFIFLWITFNAAYANVALSLHEQTSHSLLAAFRLQPCERS